ncbi:ComEA family DNA-binding protein [Actinopolymorpha pittospori]|uniref:Competence protein ComEA n=1 Tax=Actinopolymorpha pittospori TaxID=648752 RepID=A0A927MXJ3_9ACTN|nr:competence protein ComEA [Actinopolymorpha pittospori]
MLRRRLSHQRRVRVEDTIRATRRLRALRRPRLRVGGWVPSVDAAARARGVPGQEEASEPVGEFGADKETADVDAALRREPTPEGLVEPRATHRARAASAVEAVSLAWTLRRGHVVAVAVLLLVAVLGAGVMVLRSRPVREEVPDPPAASVVTSPRPSPVAASGPALVTPSPTPVVVHVAGKVRKPGVVHLPAGSRVVDAVTASGGALPGTDLDTVNLARQLVDGEQVLVGVTPPPGSQLPPSNGPGGGPGVPTPGGELVDLNTATAAELETLPGVGPVLAQRILDFRAEHGRFLSIEDLREVSGIGEQKYVDLQARVRVS